MIAFIRHASEPCAGSVPDMWSFEALSLMMVAKPPIAEEEVQAKEKDVQQFRARLGLQKWCQLYALEMKEAHDFANMPRGR
jgi:hypothetical protein